jgi:hypothetical protein
MYSVAWSCLRESPASVANAGEATVGEVTLGEATADEIAVGEATTAGRSHCRWKHHCVEASASSGSDKACLGESTVGEAIMGKAIAVKRCKLSYKGDYTRYCIYSQ